MSETNTVSVALALGTYIQVPAPSFVVTWKPITGVMQFPSVPSDASDKIMSAFAGVADDGFSMLDCDHVCTTASDTLEEMHHERFAYNKPCAAGGEEEEEEEDACSDKGTRKECL